MNGATLEIPVKLKDKEWEAIFSRMSPKARELIANGAATKIAMKGKDNGLVHSK